MGEVEASQWLKKPAQNGHACYTPVEQATSMLTAARGAEKECGQAGALMLYCRRKLKNISSQHHTETVVF